MNPYSQYEPPKPLCIYCGQHCYVKTTEKRYDGVYWIASCPRGKALDRACNEIAEAHYNVEKRTRDGKEPPKPWNPFDPNNQDF